MTDEKLILDEIIPESLTVSGQQRHPEPFPMVYGFHAGKKKIDGVVDWIQHERDSLLAQLTTTGAMLFRGFPVASDLEFDSFIRAFGLKNLAYDDTFSNAIRSNRTSRVFTANEAPPSVPIFLHHELAQTPVYPSHLFFFCEQSPETGGETLLCRSDVLFESLAHEVPEFIESCKNLGIRYTNIMPLNEDEESGQGRSWCSTLSTNKKLSAEEKLRHLGYQWEWQEDGSIRVVTPVMPAIRKLDDKRCVFFNQLIAAYRGWDGGCSESQKTISFGDGSEISGKTMSIVSDLADHLSFNLVWEKGDVALINNSLVLHGRKTYIGQRSVLASLAVDTHSLFSDQ